MSWIQHRCPLPDKHDVQKQRAVVGDMWICDVCQKVWKIASLLQDWEGDVMAVNWEEVVVE